jgi:DNA-binding transcriptional LysR family regulator
MGKAAAELAISQPSISKAIADAEHAIGMRLLDRGPHGVEPTMYGRALLKCGLAVFDELRQGVKALEFLSDPTSGELRIGSTEALAAGFMSAVLDRFSRQYPRAAFHLVPADSVTLVERELRQRNVELVITSTSTVVPDRDVEIENLFTDRFVVMASWESKWIRRRKLALADLIDERWIFPPWDSAPGRSIAQAFRASGLEPPRAHIISFSFALHHSILSTGRFVTMLPMSMLRFATHLRLKRLPVKAPDAAYPIGIVTLKNRTLSPLAQLFIASAREMARSGNKAN